MKRVLISLLAATLLAACASKPATPPPVDDKSKPSTTTTPPPATSTTPTTPSTVAADPLNDPNSPLAKRIIYFDFDSNVIKAEFEPTIRAHAKYLADNPARRITIDGHTDERGSREYNLALGQRRADAVRRAMGVLGVAENRVETVSFGEEKPADPGHDEGAWGKNRRAELKYGGQ